MRALRWSLVCACIMALGCSNLSAQAPAPRPQFEVASVKPAVKDEAGGRLPMMMREMRRENMQPGTIPMDDPGRIRLENWALLDLIAAAYRVRASQVSGPAWISGQDFDIEAKVPRGTPKEQLNAMLQSLLEERFGLKVHRESQIKNGFALLVAKNGPQLEPAAKPLTDEQRAKRFAATVERMAQMQQAGTPLTGFSRLNLPSVTAEGLAMQLARFAEAPVIDRTGLTGKYSVVIETWKNPDVPGGTVFDAVAKLGLKLEPRKVTVETVVVDRVFRTPTAN